jgi:hypothetical protein
MMVYKIICSARKEHICSRCGAVIHIGDTYKSGWDGSNSLVDKVCGNCETAKGEIVIMRSTKPLVMHFGKDWHEESIIDAYSSIFSAMRS